jgi:hypothetical protein
VTYLLIAFVVMVALSPLISMMPTRRQRQIADLRQQAAILGLTVQLRERPDASGSGEILPFYGRHRQRSDRKCSGNVVYRRSGDNWSASTGSIPTPLPTLFAGLPEGVSHVCESLHDVGLFWDERGPEADVERIDEVLQQLLQRGGLQEN